MKGYRFIKPNKNSRWSDPFVIQDGRFKDGKIDTVYRAEWSEDAYISEAGQKEKMKSSFNKSRLLVLGIFISLFMFVLLSKTAWLQIVKRDYYYSMAEGNRIRIERLEPKRGVIYDRFLRPLVRNRANFMLYFLPIDLPRKKEDLVKIVDDIVSIVGDIGRDSLLQKIGSISRYSLDAYQPIFVIDNIPYEAAMKLYLKSSDWPGVVLSNRTNREYLSYGISKASSTTQFFSLSHIMGYTGKINDQELKIVGNEYLPIDYIGKMGIEYFWENELKGRSGKKEIEVDALGKEKKIAGQEDAQDGHNLVLSLDALQQVKLEEIFDKYLKELKLTKAVGLVTNPSNGEILAMVSLPTYNNNVFARGIKSNEYEKLLKEEDRPLFNRAISGEYPPGSTFKPIVLAGALQEKVVSEDTSFLSTGGIRIGQWFFPDWKAGGHGRTDARSAIANSVNTYFYTIGGGNGDFTGLGVERIGEYAKIFGLDSQTGIDMAGEQNGFVPTAEWKEEEKKERWYIGDTYHLAIGQGDLLVTPLQVAAYTGVFANKGKLYRPHFVKYILSGEDKPVSETEIVPVRENFIDDYNLKVVREGMRDTVAYGSARSMLIVPVPVAGKTGTAQWSTKKANHAWFTGFAPFDNPEITITILVEEGGEGSTAAVPIAREFLQWYFGEYKKAKVESKK